MVDCFKFLVIAVVVCVPMFIFASELDGDEFAKSSMGIAMGAIAFGAFQMLQAQWQKRKPPEK